MHRLTPVLIAGSLWLCLAGCTTHRGPNGWEQIMQAQGMALHDPYTYGDPTRGVPYSTSYTTTPEAYAVATTGPITGLSGPSPLQTYEATYGPTTGLSALQTYQAALLQYRTAQSLKRLEHMEHHLYHDTHPSRLMQETQARARRPLTSGWYHGHKSGVFVQPRH